MSITINRSDFFLILFSIFCFISFQLTEIKFYSIKINELVALMCLPLLLRYVRNINKYFLYFLIFFILLLILSFIANLFQKIYFDLHNLSLLRQPYFISISRVVELFSCLIFAIIVYEAIHYFSRKGFTLKEIINAVLFINYCFAWLLLLVASVYYLKIFSYLNSDIIYDTTPYLPNYTLRLRGYYIEGGPFGLMYAFLFCLSSLVNEKKYVQKGIFILIIILAQSKAGLIAVLGWVAYKLYLKYNHTKLFKYIVFVIVLPLFIFLSFKIADNYVVTFKNFSNELLNRKDDETLIMGRTAAFLIGPKMFAHNPLIGVGLGNYSLVRNNPDYLGVLPVVSGWDLPGLGGILTLLIENGLIGLLTLILILWLIYKRYTKYSLISKDSILIFCIMCLLGVQLYFLYIWFLIGLAIAAPASEQLAFNE